MLPAPEDNLTKLNTGVAVLEEHVPGSAHSEQTLMIKLEPHMEDYHTLSQLGTNDSPATSELSQLWTIGVETSADATEQNVCALVPDDVCPNSRTCEGPEEQQGCTSRRKNLLFAEHKPVGELMTSDQHSISDQVQGHPMKQEIAVHTFTVTNDSPHKGDVFEVNLMASGDHEDSGEQQDFSGHNCFICSSCGQSFNSFSLFQMHRCKNLT